MNFNRIASYYGTNSYSSIYYDSISSLFYVSGGSHGVSIFDTNCNFKPYITMGGYSPSKPLNYFNGTLYGDYGNSILVASKVTGAFVAKYNTLCSNDIYSITINSFGYMAISCLNDGPIFLYNATNAT